MGFDDRLKFHDVWVFQLMQDSHFSVSALSIYFILKCIKHFFKSVFFASLFMGYFPDMSVGSTAEELLNIEESQDMTLYFFTHALLI